MVRVVLPLLSIVVEYYFFVFLVVATAAFITAFWFWESFGAWAFK